MTKREHSRSESARKWLEVGRPETMTRTVSLPSQTISTEEFLLEKPPILRPTWAEVSLGALRNNLQKLRKKLLPSVRILAVAKADGYGHGAAAVAHVAGKSDVWGLGVSSVEEGISLRKGASDIPILVLGSLYPFESFQAALRYRLTPTVASLEAARVLSKAAQEMEISTPAHLKIETGMGRIGVRPAEALTILERFRSNAWIRWEGIYTHLSSAEDDPAWTRRQLAMFRKVVASARKILPTHFLAHAANSAAILRYPESRWNMVRPGLAVYGLLPSFAPALSLKSRIVFLKTVPARTFISYGRTYRTRKSSRIATLPIGYADGVPRGLSNGMQVLVQGRRCPIVGRITMDMLMVDVTSLRYVHVGEEVCLIGRQGKEEISVGDWAERLKTIPYEIVCGISSRIPRRYV